MSKQISGNEKRLNEITSSLEGIWLKFGNDNINLIKAQSENLLGLISRSHKMYETVIELLLAKNKCFRSCQIVGLPELKSDIKELAFESNDLISILKKWMPDNKKVDDFIDVNKKYINTVTRVEINKKPLEKGDTTLTVLNRRYNHTLHAVLIDLDNIFYKILGVNTKISKSEAESLEIEFNRINTLLTEDLFNLSNTSENIRMSINKYTSEFSINLKEVTNYIYIVFTGFAFLIAIAFLYIYNKNLQLFKAKKRAESSSKANIATMNNVSHDFINNITAIQGIADIMYRTQGYDPEAYENIETILAYIGRMNESVNMLKGVTLFDTQRKAGLLPGNIQKIINSIFLDSNFKLKERDIELVFNSDFKEEQYEIYADFIKLKLVLSSFIDNAIKFTKSGEIKVDIIKKEETDKDLVVQFAISDTGIGIDKIHQKNVFKLYEQGDPSTQELYGGFGQGLAVCKHYVELMGGVIELESTKNVGSKFSFSLTLAKVPEISGIIDEILEMSDDTGSVLVVDDEKPIRIILENIFTEAGHDVTTAKDGSEALILLEKEHFDIIFMDIRMPNLNGVQALKKMNRLGIKTPTIAITANYSEKERELYTYTGFVACIGKPIDKELILRTLNRYIEID